MNFFILSPHQEEFLLWVKECYGVITYQMEIAAYVKALKRVYLEL